MIMLYSSDGWWTGWIEEWAFVPYFENCSDCAWIVPGTLDLLRS